VEIRVASPEDYGVLRTVEEAADVVFDEFGWGPFEVSVTDERLASATLVLVAGEPVIGFAGLETVDGQAHLWQLSVHPDAARRGVGSALVQAACQWARGAGFASMTLTTYRDVPWNGPFYEKLGFRPLTELTPGLAALREHERAIGEDSYGPRLAMRRDLHPA
jgi:GNAT superfamily N-acetyltransferase